ncbi:caspase family protein [Pollutibacter soli]|uniref:caspase family protein n=1 Tax=Pollutibacter soli TaxID=3034157 RepID=UPI003013DB2F
MPARTLYATIIGIDNYPQTPLYGCTRDALNIDLFFRQWCEQQKEKLIYNPAYFLSPGKVGEARLEKYKTERNYTVDYQQASFENITTKAFAHLKSAKEGDYCLLYYSGHGSQTDAPEEFQYAKSDRKNETLVCVDSRDMQKPEARDLIDKEIAFLLWDALKDKKVHCLIIMDSCHSGNNTRSFTEGIQYRHIGSSRNKIPLEKYIGYDTDRDFYKKEGGQVSFPIANYVHLAAALDFEKAQESEDGGLFTSKLVEVLRSGGTAKSYRDLMQQVVIAVHNRNAAQTPVAFSADDKNLDLGFLQQDRIAFKPVYEVRFDVSAAVWKLHAGTMDGLTSDGTTGHTTIRIAGSEKEIKVTKVYADFSVLDEAQMSGFDKTKENYQAVLASAAAKKLKVGISKALANENDIVNALKEAANKIKPIFIDILFEQNGTPDYLVQLTDENSYVLTAADGAVPLFRREKDAFSFLNNTESVAKWINTSDLFNENSIYRKEDFIFKIEKIEGQVLKLQTLDLLKGTEQLVNPEEEIVLSYRQGIQPAFRFSISIAPDSNVQKCFIGALYLDSKYGISHELISAGTTLVKGGTPVYLKTILNNYETKTLPLVIDKNYKNYNINETTAFLKIFVSDSSLNLERFNQESLELDDAVSKNFRGTDQFQIDTSHDSVVKEAEWNVFTNRIRIVGPAKEKELDAAKEADFTAFRVSVPEGISARAIAVTGDDLQRKIQSSSMRSVDGQADQLKYQVIPPDYIWGDTLVDQMPFTSGLNPSSNNGVVMLEILPPGDQPLKIPEGKEIEVKITPPVARTRSADSTDLEETIVPFGFDDEAGIWFPLGYCDDTGTIHIQELPPPTPGRISDTTLPLNRSLGGSIKMFFKKIFRRNERLNTLVLYSFATDGSWKKESEEPSKMNTILKERTAAKAALLIHGLTGDTKHIVASLKDMKDLNSKLDYVLTYDYENLSTPVTDVAASLGKDLVTAGFGKDSSPSLIIIAHSQGGMVARWLVEKENGNQYVKRLILVGVASAGSELAKLGSGLLGLITHALNGPPVVKLVITGLSFVLKKLKLDPGRTLKDTEPNSDFITKLRTNFMADGVEYSLIGGDISLLNDYTGDDPFFQRLKKMLLKEIVFPGIIGLVYHGKKTDIAVTLESMQAINGYDKTKLIIVPSNHLSYFREKLIQNELKELLS